jgi:hypothetical protein
MFPTVQRFRRLLFLDTEASPQEQRLVTARYAALVRRHLYHCGPHTTLLSKNPWFTGKIDSLAAAFPDARFVKLERTPMQSIASSVSMVHFTWRNTGALPQGVQDVERWLVVWDHYDRHARSRFAAMGPSRAHSVRFADFVADPQDEVRRLCGALDIAVSPALNDILAGEGARQRKRKSTHRYNLADWGLSEEDVARRFPEAMADAANDVSSATRRPAARGAPRP